MLHQDHLSRTITAGTNMGWEVLDHLDRTAGTGAGMPYQDHPSWMAGVAVGADWDPEALHVRAVPTGWLIWSRYTKKDTMTHHVGVTPAGWLEVNECRSGGPGVHYALEG